MPSETELLIDSLSVQFRQLLNDHWVEFWGYRNGEKPIKGTIGFTINCRRLNYELRTDFGFGIRVKRTLRARVDSPAQIQLNLGNRGNGDQNQKKTALR